MTCDHLRPLLDSPRDLHALFLIAEAFSRDQIPPSIVQLVKLVGPYCARRMVVCGALWQARSFGVWSPGPWHNS